MLLKIISNFLETADHHGTVDRDQPDIYFDYRGKAQGLYEAARALPRKLVLEKLDQQNSSELRLGAEVEIHYEDIKVPNLELPKPYRDALLSVHSKEYVEGLKNASSKLTGREINSEFGREADVWSGTYRAALSSLYACLTSVDLVIADRSNQTRAFANVWPVGHHAEGVGKDGSSDIAMGMCYFSNAAIAANYSRACGLRTLVIDIDNHSGNGTRKALMDEPDLAFVDFVYCSPFDSKKGGYLDGFFSPSKNQVICVGREFPYRHDDPKRGIKSHPVYCAPNILSLEFVGKAYRDGVQAIEPAATPGEVLDRYLGEALPWIKKFNPQLIIWSIGVDSAADDPLGGLGFAPGTYYEVIQRTSSALPQAKVMAVMEGGYKKENWERCLWPALYGLVAN